MTNFWLRTCISFQIQTPTNRYHRSTAQKPLSLQSCDTKSKLLSTADANIDQLSLTLDNIPYEFQPLFSQAALTTAISRRPVTDKQAHDPFRFEWGTWVDEDAIKTLMKCVDEVLLKAGAYDKLIALAHDEKPPFKFEVASGQDWDCRLHVLPQDTQYESRWCTGSWTILKALTGVAEISMLRETRDGGYKKSTKRSLRGGSDGSFLGGGAALSGEDCIKYVGGPLRSYMGKSGNTVLLELVVRPPISVDDDSVLVQRLDKIDDILSIFVPEEKEEQSEESEEEKDQEEVIEEITAREQAQSLGNKLGMTFDRVGGLDRALDDIVRRVLASRANPEAAKRLGISHVRGILLSGPPGCGKTLLARELARLLGARPPQIVNGPEILDKFIGEAEKRVRNLFAPAEMEYAQVGDDSALHIIILDEMDAIARKRGSVSSDTTGVRDSVVNQLLAKMDGVKEANNVLVVGLTNRPELLDPALLRPGRLEVQLRVELPDVNGRRDILRIHTRKMREAGGLSDSAFEMLEDLGKDGIPSKTEHFSGAELAGLVRSAASFALARSIDKNGVMEDDGKVDAIDLESALNEVRPAFGKQDEVLQMRFPMGVSPCSESMQRIMRDLDRFITPVESKSPRLRSLLLVGSGRGGSGATALAAWAAAQASKNGYSDYTRLVTALDLLTGNGGSGDEQRAAALIDRFSEAREMSHSLIVLDDIDQLCSGNGPGGYSSIMISTLRALLRTPPDTSTAAKAGGQSTGTRKGGKTLHIIAATSRTDAACSVLHELFEETTVVPLLSKSEEVKKLIEDAELPGLMDAEPISKLIIERMGSVGCKTALRLAERAISTAAHDDSKESTKSAQVAALELILDDLTSDEALTGNICQVF